jgi:hypothetical protein
MEARAIPTVTAGFSYSTNLAIYGACLGLGLGALVGMLSGMFSRGGSLGKHVVCGSLLGTGTLGAAGFFTGKLFVKAGGEKLVDGAREGLIRALQK